MAVTGTSDTAPFLYRQLPVPIEKPGSEINLLYSRAESLRRHLGSFHVMCGPEHWRMHSRRAPRLFLQSRVFAKGTKVVILLACSLVKHADLSELRRELVDVSRNIHYVSMYITRLW